MRLTRSLASLPTERMRSCCAAVIPNSLRTHREREREFIRKRVRATESESNSTVPTAASYAGELHLVCAHQLSAGETAKDSIKHVCESAREQLNIHMHTHICVRILTC